MAEILIVDDDPIIFRVASSFLTSLGLTIGYLPSGDMLYDRLMNDSQVNLILLDINMPGMGGLEVLQQIKSDPCFEEIPILMLTGEQDNELMTRCFELGAADFIQKPTDKSVLLARVKSALLSRKRYLDLQQNERKYKSLFYSFLDAYIEADELGNIIKASPSASKMLELHEADASGTNLSRFFVHPKDMDNVLGQLATVNTAEFLRSQMKSADGKVFWVSIIANRREIVPNVFEGYNVVLRDVTQVLKYETELASQTQLLYFIKKLQNDFITGGDPIEILDKMIGIIIPISDSPCVYMKILRRKAPDSDEFETYFEHCAENIKTGEESRKAVLKAALLDLLAVKGISSEKYIALPPNGDPCFVLPFSDSHTFKGALAFCGKPDGYSNMDLEKLTPITVSLSVILDAMEADQYVEKALGDLRTSENNYRALVENAAVGIVKYNLDGQFIDANAAYCQMMGYSLHELIGMGYKTFIAPESRPAVESKLAAFREGVDTHVDTERTFLSKQGKKVYTEVSSTCVHAKGKPDYIISVVKNITDRVEQQRLLNESEARVATIYEHADEMMGIVKVEGDGKFVFVSGNQKTKDYLKSMNISEELYFGKDVAEYAREVLKSDENAISVLLALYHQVVRQLTPVAFKESFDVMGKEKIIFETVLTPLILDGNCQSILCITRDISEKELVAKKIKDSEAQFRQLFETAPTGIMTVSPDGAIFSANPFVLKMSGYASEEIIGQNLSLLYPGYLAQGRHEKMMDSFFEDPKTRQMAKANRVVHIKKKNGELVPVEIMLSFAHTADKGNYAVAIIKDISEQEKNRQIEKSLRQRETLLKEVHHRVKNNMQIVSSLLALQAMQIVDPETKKKFSESQYRIQSMALVHEQLYRSEDFDAISAANYFSELVQYIRSSLGEALNNIKVELEIGDFFIPIDDAVPCGLIVTELIMNCFKHAFGPNGGTIKISFIESENGKRLLQVADNGKGVKSVDEMFKSNSLGMKLAKSLARQLGSKLEIKNNEGGGLMVSLMF